MYVRVDSELPADTSGDSLPDVKGRLKAFCPEIYWGIELGDTYLNGRLCCAFNKRIRTSQSEFPGSIKDENNFGMSVRVESEFPADISGASLSNVKGRLQERIFF